MKKIIVFGASGAIGKYFVNYYCEQMMRNEEYFVYAVGKRNENPFRGLPNIEYINMDISLKNEFKKLPKEEIDAVVDLAGMMPARMKGYNPYDYININIIGTLNILEYCRINKINRLLFTQSFGDIKERAEENIVLKADMQPKFNFNSDHTVYVLSKNMAVDLIENYHQKYGLINLIFRLPTIYLYDEHDTYYVDGKLHNVGYRELINRAIEGKDIEIWGDPRRLKDIVYVKDLCQIMFKAISADIDTGHYNVGTGKGVSLEDWIKGIVEIFDSNKKSTISYCPDKPNAPQYIMDISELERDFNYIPQYSYMDTLMEIKQEMKKAGKIS